MQLNWKAYPVIYHTRRESLHGKETKHFSQRTVGWIKVLNTIITGHDNLCSVSCSNEEEIWISKESEEIRCFNIQGVLKNTVKTKLGEGLNDIDVNAEGAFCILTGKQTQFAKWKMPRKRNSSRNKDGYLNNCVPPLLVSSWLPCSVMMKVKRKSCVTLAPQRNKLFSLMTKVNLFTQGMIKSNTSVKTET